MQNKDNELSPQDPDYLLNLQYKKYRHHRKHSNIGSHAKKRDIHSKENHMNVNSPQTVTFGRIKQYNKSHQSYSKLLQLLGCSTYEEAKTRVDRINKKDKLIENILQAVQMCTPQQEVTLQNSWRLIRESISFYAKHSEDINKIKRSQKGQ